MLYDHHSLPILMASSFMILIGQIIVTVFGPHVGKHSYQMLIGGRTLEGTGA